MAHYQLPNWIDNISGIFRASSMSSGSVKRSVFVRQSEIILFTILFAQLDNSSALLITYLFDITSQETQFLMAYPTPSIGPLLRCRSLQYHPRLTVLSIVDSKEKTYLDRNCPAEPSFHTWMVNFKGRLCFSRSKLNTLFTQENAANREWSLASEITVTFSLTSFPSAS